MPKDLSVFKSVLEVNVQWVQSKTFSELCKGFWEVFGEARNRILMQYVYICAYLSVHICIYTYVYTHIFLTSTTISSYFKSSGIHSIWSNPVNLNWKLVIHSCTKPARNSYRCYSKKEPKPTYKETKKTPKPPKQKKALGKTRSQI